MSEKQDGGPAFPQHDLSGYGIGPMMSGVDPSDEYSGKYEVSGMSLRDWFAGQPMIEGSLMLIDRSAAEVLCGPAPSADDAIALFKWQLRVQAVVRYMAADAMVAEAAREGGAP
jgi:hypothetical protein